MSLNIRELMAGYQEDGLSRTMASARVCQDIILKAIADGPLLSGKSRAVKSVLFYN